MKWFHPVEVHFAREEMHLEQKRKREDHEGGLVAPPAKRGLFSIRKLRLFGSLLFCFLAPGVH